MEIHQSFISFCDLFKDVAVKNPNEKAVIFNQSSISYSQLDNLSTQLAKGLVYRGVKPGDVIALGLYNGLDLIVALLAIWKANGAYLPVDPNYPSERIKMMFEDAQAKLLITKKTVKSQFDFFTGDTLLTDEIQDDYQHIELKPSEPSDLAYIMYTSGSTGKPKGIMVEQRGLKHAALAYKELHPEKPISLVCGSISFDPSLLIIIHSLVLGGTICLYDNRDGIDLENSNEVINIIKQNQVNFVLSTPSFYSKLIENGLNLSSLRNVDLCGENITNELIKNHIKIAPNAFLYNAYGPTEYAMGVTAALIYDAETQEITEVSIGKSFSCNKVYVLDSNFNKAKLEEKGELFIGGPGLARGYMNLEELNQEKFLWLDSLEEMPVRLYRTGDLGYYLPNGDIKFAGRADFQIKIKGHRVELEEVEHVVNECPEVKKAVVVTRSYPGKGMQLITFFSLKEGVTKTTLEDYLTKTLPAYMLPSRYVQIDDWPVLENGKVDRKALSGLIKT